LVKLTVTADCWVLKTLSIDFTVRVQSTLK
jgi:hypothetical protein